MKAKAVAHPYSAVRTKQRKRIESIMKRADKGEELASIARSLGISRQRVSQIISNERARLAKEGVK